MLVADAQPVAEATPVVAEAVVPEIINTEQALIALFMTVYDMPINEEGTFLGKSESEGGSSFAMTLVWIMASCGIALAAYTTFGKKFIQEVVEQRLTKGYKLMSSPKKLSVQERLLSSDNHHKDDYFKFV